MYMTNNKPTSDSSIRREVISIVISEPLLTTPRLLLLLTFQALAHIDIQNVSVTGRNAGGSITSETIALSGTTTV